MNVDLNIMVNAVNEHFKKNEDPRDYQFWDECGFKLAEGQELVVTVVKNGESTYLDSNGETGDDPDWAGDDPVEQVEIARAYGFEFCRLNVIDPLYIIVNRESWDVIAELDSIEAARETVADYVNDDMESDRAETKEVKDLEVYEKFYQIVYKLSSSGEITAFND